MFNFVNTNSIFSTIKRNENIYVFYSGANVFSFAGIYLIYKYFQSQEMLSKLHFIPIEFSKDYVNFHKENKDRIKTKNCRYFFIDCPLDREDLFLIIQNCLSAHVVDSKPTVANDLLNTLLKLPYMDLFNISFHTSGELMFIGIIWKLLTNENPPEFVQDLNRLYFNPLSDVFAVEPGIRILTKIKPDFSTWDFHFENPPIPDDFVHFHAASEFKEALDIGRRNIFHAKIFGVDAACVNCNKYMMQILATMCLTQRTFDTVVLFERTDTGYYYEVHSIGNHDLLSMFKKFKPHGFKNKIHFESNRDILLNKPTFLQRILGH